MERNFWNKHPEKLKFLIEWWPHWGTHHIASQLNIPSSTIKHKVDKLGLRLNTREKRLCFQCKLQCVSSKTQHGVLCSNCFCKKRSQNRATQILKSPREERFKELLRTLRKRSKKMGWLSDITLDHLQILWDCQNGKCFYTGRPLYVNTIAGKHGRNPDVVSVDRIDSSIGYVKSNIVLCTFWANFAKLDLSTQMFKSRCQEVCDFNDHSANRSSSTHMGATTGYAE